VTRRWSSLGIRKEGQTRLCRSEFDGHRTNELRIYDRNENDD
jgi:hypothetical protein